MARLRLVGLGAPVRFGGTGCSRRGGAGARVFSSFSLIRTYRVVFEHAHGRRGSWPRKLVEEARQGHGHEAHRDDARFH